MAYQCAVMLLNEGIKGVEVLIDQHLCSQNEGKLSLYDEIKLILNSIIKHKIQDAACASHKLHISRTTLYLNHKDRLLSLG